MKVITQEVFAFQMTMRTRYASITVEHAIEKGGGGKLINIIKVINY